MKNAFRIGAFVLVVLALLGLAFFSRRSPAVAVGYPSLREVVESISASGTVAGKDESDVAAEVGGRISHIYVREGQTVKKGQALARLETALLQAQLRQAQTALSSAQAQLLQASRGPLPSESARVGAEVTQTRRAAVAQLQSARDRLRELRKGPTREELEQARGGSAQARSQMEQSQREALRLQRLFGEGALSRQDLERAQTQARVAQSTYLTAYNRYRQAQVGNRPEVLAQAQAQVALAEANDAGAQDTGQARLQNLRETPRSEDVEVARARLEEARANLEVSRQRLKQCEILAPYDGTVTRIILKAGQLTGANAPILHFVKSNALEIQVNVDENNLGRLKVGQSAFVSNDAYPENFTARLREIAPQVISERGTVQLKLDPQKPPDWLRPGQTVSVNIVFAKGTQRPIVPLPSVTIAGRRSTVLVLAAGRLEEREVRLGAPDASGFPVYSGITEKELVVLNRANLLPGQRARAQ